MLIIAVLVVGALVWKPWDHGASPTPTPPAVAIVPTPLPLSTPVTLSGGDLQPSTAPQTPASPPPTAGIQADASTYAAPDELGTVTLDGGGGIAKTADAERVLAGDLHEVGGFREASGDFLILHAGLIFNSKTTPYRSWLRSETRSEARSEPRMPASGAWPA